MYTVNNKTVAPGCSGKSDLLDRFLTNSSTIINGGLPVSCSEYFPKKEAISTLELKTRDDDPPITQKQGKTFLLICLIQTFFLPYSALIPLLQFPFWKYISHEGI
eukprot:TRINITY_DN2118_c0_g1_i27.p1 TRINITY_DN2118_c0_g1~~TRINITY_DN2118_c0_g1_i27.p1  ORF type:complete len:105 (-),score=10.27 TRINITY_DN2118_c0_g1_i27:1-315(-)